MGVPWWDPTKAICATVLFPPADYAWPGVPHMGGSAGPGGGGTIYRWTVLDHYIATLLDTLLHFGYFFLDWNQSSLSWKDLWKATLPSKLFVLQ